MIKINFVILAVAAIIPLLTGFFWYNPKVFGTMWLKEIGKSDTDMRSNSNMLKIFGFTYLFSLLLACMLQFLCIHQLALFSLIGGNEATAKPSYFAFMTDYLHDFRTFKHGAFHGLIFGLFVSFALIGINSLFELRSWKYILMHVGYWTITCMLMAGVICQFT